MKLHNVVVTGANGFLGSHVVHILQKESVTLSLLDKDIHDLFRPKSLAPLLTGASVVVHLAGANRDANEQLANVNILGTVRLVEAMRLYCPDATLVFASSAQVTWGNSFYGWTKQCAEEIIAYENRSRGFQAVILRFSNLYGPGGRPFYNSVIATYAHLIRIGKPIDMSGDGEQKRDYLYVADAADAIVRAMNYTGADRCPTFDICSGQPVSLNVIIQDMEQILGHTVAVSHKHLGVAEAKYPEQSFEKASAMLGWKPKTKLRDGLRLTLTS